jgi:membrane protein YqaA with SNARE-associated domain
LTHFFRHLIRLAYHAGGIGLLTVGMLDSSFLILPLGNDLLLLTLSANHHTRVAYYAVMATTGSVLGTAVTQWLGQKGERGLRRKIPNKRLQSLEKMIEKNAGWALAFASIMPPPFPFTGFVAAAAALGYPRRKLLAVIAAARFVRFTVEGLLAVHYGRVILAFVRSDQIKYFVIPIIILSIGASEAQFLIDPTAIYFINVIAI